jgi:crotonobetainyl-CoA:carnitine CoA-transferase CaiB-like acyl-CoA transferase
VLDLPALADDPRFATNGARVRNRVELIERLHGALRRRSVAHWLAALDAAGIPCGPIQTIDEVVAHEQTKALDILRTTDDGAASFVGLPVSFGGTRPARNGRTPKLGEHNHLLAKTPWETT